MEPQGIFVWDLLRYHAGRLGPVTAALYGDTFSVSHPENSLERCQSYVPI